MPTAHAFLAPSASKRWMSCPPSAKAESGYPEQDTVYTKEGTLAHAVGELLLNGYKAAGQLSTFEEIKAEIQGTQPGDFVDLCNQAEALGVDFWDMVETVHEFYVVPVFEDYIHAKAKDPEAKLLVEAELTLTRFIPEGFGSSDAVIISGEDLRVYDLKYGRGVKVDAEYNPQMMCYALGALFGPAELYDIKNVFMTILQPRLRHTSTFAIFEDELVAWGDEVLRPAAERAFKGEGKYNPGTHCKFCKAAPRCRALALTSQVAAEAYAEPEMLDMQELADLLEKLPTIKDWATHVEEYAMTLIQNRGNIPGWKLVEGRSISKITDQQSAIRILEEGGFDASLYMKAPELKSVSDLKKLLRPKPFEQLLGSLVVKPQGKPTLAPADDPRPEYSTASTDFQNL